MALSRFVVTADVVIPWPATWAEIVNGPASGAVTTPAIPASTVAVQNPNSLPVTVVITGGTMTAVVVNGTTVGTGAGTGEDARARSSAFVDPRAFPELHGRNGHDQPPGQGTISREAHQEG
jgi:hypothetical protein